ncbi:hypothetical protein [Paraburkholderia fungorum]|uniref:hypothetical protein n=1 Tax=Paraburkholderia fungorum TaxID=134537 RepID=UPI00160809D2|nr:hypothetical protein [Paraburkholderia fungorum]MBB5546550.1 hypothetical protein [Paraburkholderia fungorum]
MNSNNRSAIRQRRIVACFQPQAWVNNCATDVDGQQDLDVTGVVLNMDLNRIHALEDYRDSTDILVNPVALGHNGPFTVRVVDSVCEYFDVGALAEVTQEHIDEARSEVTLVGGKPLESAFTANQNVVFSSTTPDGSVQGGFADEFVAADTATKLPAPELFSGNWNHLFGPGTAETRCRIVIDAANETLIAAQAFDGLKWVDLSSAEKADLSESLFEANDVCRAPKDWDLSPIESFPRWASPQESPEQPDADVLLGAAAALRPFAEIGAWLFARNLPDDTPLVDVKLLNGAATSLMRGAFKAAFTACQAIEDHRESSAPAGPIDLLTRLVRWAEHMGGWEAPVWEEAFSFLAARQAASPTEAQSPDRPVTSTAVRKTVIQFSVLHDDGKDLSSMSLGDIACECDEGGYVGGGLLVVSSEALTREQLEFEAEKLGSEATFFEDDSTKESPTPSV